MDHKSTIVKFYTNGQKFREEWYHQNLLHREEGPAYSTWQKDGKILREEWYYKNKLHREDGPARTTWWVNGNLLSQEWRIMNKVHRMDGPAYIEYNVHGQIKSTKWFYNGKELTDTVNLLNYTYPLTTEEYLHVIMVLD